MTVELVLFHCRFESREEPESLLEYSRNFGRSLLAGHSDHYLSDFVLHGTSDSNYLSKLHSDLSSSVQSSVLDESIAEAACVVADTDQWYSCRFHFIVLCSISQGCVQPFF